MKTEQLIEAATLLIDREESRNPYNYHRLKVLENLKAELEWGHQAPTATKKLKAIRCAEKLIELLKS